MLNLERFEVTFVNEDKSWVYITSWKTVLIVTSGPLFCLTENPPHARKKKREKKKVLSKYHPHRRKKKKALISLATNGYFETWALWLWWGVQLPDRLNWTQNPDSLLHYQKWHNQRVSEVQCRSSDKWGVPPACLVPEKGKVEYSIAPEGFEVNRSNFHLISSTVPVTALGCVVFSSVPTWAAVLTTSSYRKTGVQSTRTHAAF